MSLSFNDDPEEIDYRGSTAVQEATNQLVLGTHFRARPLAKAVMNANQMEFRSREEALAIRDAMLRSLDSLMETKVVVQEQVLATLSFNMLNVLADLRSAICLRFPFFNSATATALEREFDEETNAIIALHEMVGNTDELDFFLTDNNLFDGFIPPGKPIRAETAEV